MDIQVIASGSSGNCYRVSDGQTALLLECGLNIQKIKQGTNFRLSETAACLLTHGHKDHSKAVKDIMKSGIDVYCSQGTAEELNISGHRLHTIKPMQWHRIGTFEVMAFDVVHDTKEPFGFVVRNKTDKLLYLTDTAYSKYSFKGLTRVMVECNYIGDILKQNTETGRLDMTLKNRLLKTHFSLENVKKFLKACDLSKVREVYLLHLSKDNSDVARIKKEIQGLTGKLVKIGGYDD